MTLLGGIVICAACGGTYNRKSASLAEQASDVRDTLPSAAQPARAFSTEAPAARPNATAAAGDTVTICVVGDIMMGTTYPRVQLPPDEGRELFRDCGDLLRRADVACGNLEGAMTDGGKSTKRGGTHSYSFRMPTCFAPRLSEAGFDFLGLANNHANDFGPDGIRSTERCLTEQGIGFAGIKGHEESVVKEIGGIKYGFCAFGHNRYTLRHQETGEVRRIISDLRERCDILIVSFHGGGEGGGFCHLPDGRETFLGEDRGSLREFARISIDSGADLVYGHGPHVVRAVEVYKERFIAYSLGNFCTPYGISVSGINGYAPAIEVKLGRDGRFLGGKIHSFVQQHGEGPHWDETCAPAREIKSLTEADIQGRSFFIDNDGTIRIATE